MYFLRLSSISCPPLHADQSSPYLSGYAVNLPRNAQVLYSSKLICTLLVAGQPSVSCEQFQCNTCSLWSLQNCCKRNSITILVFFQWLLKWDFVILFFEKTPLHWSCWTFPIPLMSLSSLHIHVRVVMVNFTASPFLWSLCWHNRYITEPLVRISK